MMVLNKVRNGNKEVWWSASIRVFALICWFLFSTQTKKEPIDRRTRAPDFLFFHKEVVWVTLNMSGNSSPRRLAIGARTTSIAASAAVIRTRKNWTLQGTRVVRLRSPSTAPVLVRSLRDPLPTPLGCGAGKMDNPPNGSLIPLKNQAPSFAGVMRGGTGELPRAATPHNFFINVC